MKVKLLISRAGPDFSQTAGEVIEVDQAEALRMIAAGQADALPEQVETATAKKPVQKREKS
jgi:hypothetical protein